MAMITGSRTVCPEERRAHTRRHRHEEWRRRPEYRRRKSLFLAKHPWCIVWLEVGVKVPATEIHHPNDWSYASFELYVDFEHNGAMPVSGSRGGGGHYAIHHGLKICPVCKKNKCGIYATACRACEMKLNPWLAEALTRAKEQQRIDKNARAKRKRAKKAYLEHPCARRGTEQRCRLGGICKYRKDNAKKCEKFRGKLPRETVK